MELCLQALSLCGKGSDPETSEQTKKNRQIDKQISSSKAALRKEQKILLLGTGECGKSTFIKQMRIILGGGFPEDQYEYYLRVVHKNLLQATASLGTAMETLDISYTDSSLSDDTAPLVEEFDEKAEPYLLEGSKLEIIKRLWADKGVMECYDRRREYQLLDSAKYFLDRIPEIEQPGFRVDLQDILRTRVKTTGIIEEVFNVDRINLRIIDVGGQRRERRKWIHSFEGVTSVIFLASLSEYDMFLEECKTKNRTEESLQLFKEIIKYRVFKDSSNILFLNKTDQFEEKVMGGVHIDDFLSSYTGARYDVANGMDFFRNLYIAAREDAFQEAGYASPTAPFFIHFTCATDTNTIRKIFDNIKATVFIGNLDNMAL